MKRSIAVALAICVGTAFVGGQGRGNPFVDHSDTGETVHVLPAPAAIRSPRDTQPTFAPSIPGLTPYAPSYGSGNLLNHGGHQIPNAGFFAIYWNESVANAGGAGVTSNSYVSIQAQVEAFAAMFASGTNYSGAANDDYTVIQQYGTADPIAPSLGFGYHVDAQATRSSIKDSDIQRYFAGLFRAGTVTASPNMIYGVYFPAGMKVVLQGGTSCSAFCGYHGHFNYAGIDVKYASFPYTNCRACSLAGLSVADMLTIVTSHEIREAVTDPDLNAWYDAAGYEADDKCAWHNLYQTAVGGFWVQPEFSNGGTVTASGLTTTYPSLPSGGGACVVAR